MYNVVISGWRKNNGPQSPQNSCECARARVWVITLPRFNWPVLLLCRQGCGRLLTHFACSVVMATAWLGCERVLQSHLCARTPGASVCVFFIISVINVQPQYRRNQHGRHVLSTEVPFYTRWLHLIKAGAWSFGQSSATSSHACTPAHPHEWTPQHQVVVQIHPHTSDSHCVDKAVASLIQTLKSLGHRLTLAFRFSSNCQVRRK